MYMRCTHEMYTEQQYLSEVPPEVRRLRPG